MSRRVPSDRRHEAAAKPRQSLCGGANGFVVGVGKTQTPTGYYDEVDVLRDHLVVWHTRLAGVGGVDAVVAQLSRTSATSPSGAVYPGTNAPSNDRSG